MSLKIADSATYQKLGSSDLCLILSIVILRQSERQPYYGMAMSVLPSVCGHLYRFCVIHNTIIFSGFSRNFVQLLQTY